MVAFTSVEKNKQ